MPINTALGSRIVLGFVAGYLLGTFVRKLLQKAIIKTGLVLLLIGGLQQARWIKINFVQITSDL